MKSTSSALATQDKPVVSRSTNAQQIRGTSSVTRKGQITIPVEIREKLGIREGDRIVLMLRGDTIVARQANELISALRGVAGRASRAKEETKSMADTIDEENEIIAQGWAGEPDGYGE
jgi:AbrB family looped-hinge helix DNA binding protein